MKLLRFKDVRISQKGFFSGVFFSILLIVREIVLIFIISILFFFLVISYFFVIAIVSYSIYRAVVVKKGKPDLTNIQ